MNDAIRYRSIGITVVRRNHRHKCWFVAQLCKCEPEMTLTHVMTETEEPRNKQPESVLAPKPLFCWYSFLLPAAGSYLQFIDQPEGRNMKHFQLVKEDHRQTTSLPVLRALEAEMTRSPWRNVRMKDGVRLSCFLLVDIPKC